MNLQLLDFDCTEDAEGVVCWDALTQAAPAHNSALLDEVAQVLAWCHRFDPHGPGPLEDGANWDFDLQVTLLAEDPPLRADARFDLASGRVQIVPAAGSRQMALSLSLSGTPAFAQAFREHAGLP